MTLITVSRAVTTRQFDYTSTAATRTVNPETGITSTLVFEKVTAPAPYNHKWVAVGFVESRIKPGTKGTRQYRGGYEGSIYGAEQTVGLWHKTATEAVFDLEALLRNRDERAARRAVVEDEATEAEATEAEGFNPQPGDLVRITGVVGKMPTGELVDIGADWAQVKVNGRIEVVPNDCLYPLVRAAVPTRRRHPGVYAGFEFVGPEHRSTSRVFVARLGRFVFEGITADNRRPGFYDNEAEALAHVARLDYAAKAEQAEAEAARLEAAEVDLGTEGGRDAYRARVAADNARTLATLAEAVAVDAAPEGEALEAVMAAEELARLAEGEAVQAEAEADREARQLLEGFAPEATEAELDEALAEATADMLARLFDDTVAHVVAARIPWCGKTSAEWKAMGRQQWADSHESFQRCDTDGFLSQWAHDQLAHHYQACSEFALDPTANVDAVFDLEGRPVEGRWIDGQYGRAFMYGPAGARKFFRPSEARSAERRRATDARKGLYLGRVLVRVEVNPRSTRFVFTDDVVAVCDDGVHRIGADPRAEELRDMFTPEG